MVNKTSSGFSLITSLKSITFLSWWPVLFYLSTGWSGILKLKPFGRLDFDFGMGEYDHGFKSIFILAAILIFLLKFGLDIDRILSSKVTRELQPFFHGFVLTLVIIFASLFFRHGFDLIIKLGVVWSYMAILWFISGEKIG